MNLLVTIIQVFSSLLTIISAIGLFGIPEKLPEYEIQTTHVQIAFGLSLLLAILSIIFGKKIRPSDTKNQTQIGGRGNTQNMK